MTLSFVRENKKSDFFIGLKASLTLGISRIMVFFILSEMFGMYDMEQIEDVAPDVLYRDVCVPMVVAVGVLGTVSDDVSFGFLRVLMKPRINLIGKPFFIRELMAMLMCSSSYCLLINERIRWMIAGGKTCS